MQISNLDLNENGEVDYLRVVESSMNQTYLVSIQAVLGEDLYQDVASFDVEKDPEGQAQVQVMGDPYIYGENYVVRPTYVRPPAYCRVVLGGLPPGMALPVFL